DPEHYKDPPVAYELFYMAFVHSESEINTRLIDEQRILGRVLQKFCDYRRIPQEYLMGTLKENKEILDIQGLNLTIDEKIKIWSLFNEPYRTSFFYKAGPVFMESDLIKTTKRVISANISTRHK
ncbi:MAG: Pvc16 family protein, partial [Anaerotignaceae bacterium]